MIPQRSKACGRVTAAEHGDFLGARRTRPLRQPLRAAEQRQKADRDLDLPEERGVGREDHVAGQRELKATAQRAAIDRRHRRHRHVFELTQHRFEFRLVGVDPRARAP